METVVFTKNTTKKEEALFAKYVESKKPQIESLLTKFAEDACILKASLAKFEKHDAYEVELNLQLPLRSVVAKEASHTVNKAVDLSKDRLLGQLKKHVSLLRRDRSHQSIRTDQEVASGVEIAEFEHLA